MNTLINATLNLFVGILRRSGLLSGGSSGPSTAVLTSSFL
jgi:hypothetical protein